MAAEYRLLIDYDALTFIEQLPRREAIAIRNRLVEISENPTYFSDCQEKDCTGRPLDIHILGRFAIRYWHDFNDKHVKILEVGYADRA